LIKDLFMRKESMIVLVAASLFSACARHVPEPAVAIPGTPHVSWIIMSGDSDNPDREFVCQSEPRTECVMPVSRPEAQVFSDVHIYYHGAGAETRYTGTVQIRFFAGSPAANTMKTDIAVKKIERIANQSVSNVVTSTPGAYSVDFAHVATVVDTKKTQELKEQIKVVVK
jgi:hypothetical protein